MISRVLETSDAERCVETAICKYYQVGADMDSTPVLQHAQKATDAINCLVECGHHLAAVMMIYAAMDQMAWLSIRGDSTANDFKDWVKKYILKNSDLVCSEHELWAARNGLLHMGIAEARDHKKDTAIKKIYYTVGGAASANETNDGVVFLSIEKLTAAYLCGVLWFMEDLKGDQCQLSVALEKIRGVLKYNPKFELQQ